MDASTTSLRLQLAPGESVGALLDLPPAPTAALVLAHGAGAGMQHPFMAGIAAALAGRGVAVLRYQFPSMERGSRRVDAPDVAQACVRAAVAYASSRLAGLPLFAGGKSFGGRMTSQAQALEPLPRVRGLVFLGFPLHPAGKPGSERAAHLRQVQLPMLFLQGTRDALAEPARIQAVAEALRPHARLKMVEGADHGFAVLARSGRTAGEVMDELAGTASAWIAAVAADAPHG